MALPQVSLEQFQTVVLQLLESRPEGISEYDLFNLLAELGYPEYLEQTRRESLGLFRAHFRLFHALYNLRDRLWESRTAHVEISALHIALRPYSAQSSDVPSKRDLLRDYYLDLANLETTTHTDLNKMLNRFWRRFANDARDRALEVLGLSDPVDDVTIKQTYRRLAMRHHPDRGGSDGRLQEINAAVAALLHQ